MRIQHNIMAMSAYRNYTNNTSALAKNLEKLSSGYRINRAGDDAAGLAISEKMRAQITALGTAQKNVKDGISLVKTAEGATQEVHDMLNRMVDLATQSANGTYQDEVDREAIEQEFNALKTEIDRIADSSNFNGIKLLDGSLSKAGKPASVTDVKLTPTHDNTGDAKAAQKGEFTIDLKEWGAKAATAVASGDTLLTLSIGGKTIDLKANATVGKGSAVDGTKLKVASNSTLSIGGLTFDVTMSAGVLTLKGKADPTAAQAEAFNKVDLEASYTAGAKVEANDRQKDHAVHVKQAVQAKVDPQKATASFTLDNASIKDGASITIGDTTYSFKVGANGKGGSGTVLNLSSLEEGDAGLAQLAGQLLSQQTHAKFDITTDNQGGISLTEKGDWAAADYEAMDVRGSLSKDGDAPWTMKDGSSIVKMGTVATAGKSLTLQIGEDSEKYNQLELDIQDLHVAALNLDKHTLSTQKGAQDAVAAIKDAINTVSTVRSGLGATQNRLEHTSNNLSVMKENIQDAESTIRDTDVAEEMMAYTKNNILVQSAQAMLAQANQIPQGVLQLLG